MAKTEYEKWLSNRAKELRATPTKAEEKMKKFLIENKIPYKSQVVIKVSPQKGYIVDFVLFKKVVLEIDGDIHYSEERKEYDRKRTADIESKGYKVIRMRNDSTEWNNIHRVIINRFEKVAPGTAKRLKEQVEAKEREKRKRKYERIKADREAKLPDWNFRERMWDMSGGHFPIKNPSLKH